MKYSYNQKIKGPLQKMVDEIENTAPYHIRIVISIHKPHDETFTPLIGKQVEPVDATTAKKAEHDIWSIAPQARRRKAFMMSQKTIGMGPQCVRNGDEIVVMLGCRVPVVLRMKEGGGWVNIGDAYVDGYIDGEGVKGFEQGNMTAEVFEVH
jgi:hypothetical protein